MLTMIVPALVLGIILIIIGVLLPAPVLYTLGGILAAVAVVLLILDALGVGLGRLGSRR